MTAVDALLQNGMDTLRAGCLDSSRRFDMMMM
eukprot:CAMPEP_0174762596 /NCGR_PEP_ID=MMETSP1094-20130205/109860_1 /TAXON_ID=156173 /ORGANISM="Chrysochromulina brevifilum, Strain UTEX LB 985" /LENGTH=31 /DNA_ID= /DNA_START= /DNA_END= /DNA_ORIENTATION=